MPLLIIDPNLVSASLVGQKEYHTVVSDTPQPVLYAITALNCPLPGGSALAREGRRLRLLADLQRWGAAGVHFVQLREKAITGEELHLLANTAMAVLRGKPLGSRPRVLINGRVDIAAASGSDGVHLTSRPGELHPDQARAVFLNAGLSSCTVSVSCHSRQEVLSARNAGADLVLWGPVFEKRVGSRHVDTGQGLAELQAIAAIAHPVPVLALGGVSQERIADCLAAGAAGVAGIRLFA